MRLAVSVIASLLFASAAYAGSIGVFTATSGEVQVLRGPNYLAAAAGVEVQPNDIVEAGKGATAQLDMEDGTVLKLGPETRLALSDYQLDSGNNVISATLDVLSGWLRFAVAKLRPDRRYDFNTPVLTIGVRGTEGTIEAENEQGGLHLEEGTVDVTPFGQDVSALQPVRVRSGEFIQRMRGQPLAKLSQPPAAFRNRLPPVVQQKLIRRAHELKARGVPPKVIRAITGDDARRIMERHPHLQEKLRERFKPLGVKAPLRPGAGKSVAPGRDGDGAAPPGTGGQRRREQQLRTGSPGDPEEVSEARRKRLQQQREQRKAADPRFGDGPQRRPPQPPER